MNTKYKIQSTKYIFISIVILMSFVSLAHAASFTVSPVVIDRKAKARDILKESVMLTNTAGRKLNIYTFVNNVSIQEGKQEFLDPSRANHSSSFANWIKISRGVIELLPGEKRTVDFQIDVNLRAQPGMYHALISFAEGSRRVEAEKKLRDSPLSTINLEVIEDIKERLQLKKFVSDKTFFSGSPISFSYELENIGNRSLAPSGEIRIYNRRGEEVAVIDANADGKELQPDATLQLAGVWQGGKGFGRYKALLNLEYGAKQRGTFQDTVFFWVIPWQKILIIFVVLASFVILVTYFWHRRYEKRRS